MIGGAIRGFALASAGGSTVSKVFTGVDARFEARNGERKAQASGTRPKVTKATRKAAVERYLAAITDPENAFTIPMAPRCVRVNQGIPTGFGRDHLQWDLHLHLGNSLVGELEILGWVLDVPDRPDVIHVDYRLRPKIGPVLLIGEDFTVPRTDGLIHRIETRVTHLGEKSESDPDAAPAS